MRSEPRGYWTHVFESADTLLKLNPTMNGDQAYWAARRIVDQTLKESGQMTPRMSDYNEGEVKPLCRCDETKGGEG